MTMAELLEQLATKSANEAVSTERLKEPLVVDDQELSTEGPQQEQAPPTDASPNRRERRQGSVRGILRRNSSKALGDMLIQLTKVSGGTKLYGRQKERDLLIKCWDRCGQTKKQEIVVISGSPGTGKSTLADALRPIVNKDKPRAFFVSGKFAESDHHRKGPFEVFVAAFTSYVHQLLDSGDQELIRRCKQNVKEAVNKDYKVLIKMIPAFEVLLVDGTLRRRSSDGAGIDSGFQTRLFGSESSNRLRNAFSKAVAAICSCTPLVLFLDDIQWAGTSSLDVLRSLMQSEFQMPLLVVATARSEPPLLLDANASSLHINEKKKILFYATLKEFGADDTVHVTSIDLSDFGLEQVQLLLGAVLNRERADVLELARVAHAQTHGNVFHLLQFLRLLLEEQVIERNGDRWVWDNATLGSVVGSAESILELVVKSIQSMPPPVQEALKVASCLGNEIDASALDRVLQTPGDPLLQQASNEGFVVFSPQYGGYRFSHDWIRHAAYSLIPKEEIGEFHLKIGRRLWRGQSAPVVEQNCMLIVSLMFMGADQITDPRERYKVAELSLKAARKALLLPSFPDAAGYLKQGIGLLGNDCWDGEHYQLALELYSNTSEIEAFNGNFEIVATCINQVVQHGRTLDDKLQAYTALLLSMEQQDDIQEALSVCTDVLAQLGEKLPKRNTKLTVIKEFLRVRFKLKGKSDEELLNLPLMKDTSKVDCMHFLLSGCTLGWKTRDPASAVFAFRSVLLTLRHGMHETSAIAFAMYAVTLCGVLLDMEEGYRFGKLALKLAERSNNPKIISHTNLIIGGGAIHWSRPVPESLELLGFAGSVGLEAGYVHNGIQARFVSNFVCHAIGRKLAGTKKSIKQAIKLCRLHHNKSMGIGCSLILQMVDCYQGNTPDPCRVTGTAIDFEETLRHSLGSNDKVMVILHYYYQMEVCYVHGDIVEASRMAQRCMQCLAGSPSTTLIAAVMEVEAVLIAVASYRTGANQFSNLKTARAHAKRVVRWAKSSPTVFDHWSLFLQAELSSLKKGKRNIKPTCQLYTLAFGHAQGEEHLMCMALILERWGDYLHDNHEKQNALIQWSKAADAFETWGAVIKSKRLREKLGSM